VGARARVVAHLGVLADREAVLAQQLAELDEVVGRRARSAGRRVGDVLLERVPLLVGDRRIAAGDGRPHVAAESEPAAEREQLQTRARPRFPARVLAVEPLRAAPEPGVRRDPDLDVDAVADELRHVRLVALGVDLGGRAHADRVDQGEVGGARRRELLHELLLDVVGRGERRRIGRGLGFRGEDRGSPDLEEQHADDDQ
jgi:hypothetical protein